MKKQLAIALTLALLTSPVTSAAALADTTSPVVDPATAVVLDANGQAVDPGVLPDSPFYWFTTLIDKLQLALTMDPEKKAALSQEQALEKLAEAQAMSEQGNSEDAKKALEQYNEKLAAAQAFLAQVQDPNSESAQQLQQAMAQTNANNIEVLSSLLDKLPPQASQQVALDVVKSMEHSLDKMNEADKKKVGQELKQSLEGIDESTLDEVTKDALEQYQETIKKAVKQEGHDNNANDENKANELNNEQGEEDNTVLLSEDPNQPAKTIGQEKQAEQAKQENEKSQETVKKQEEQTNQEQERNQETVKKQGEQTKQEQENNGEAVKKQAEDQAEQANAPAGQNDVQEQESGEDGQNETAGGHGTGNNH